MNNGQRFEVTDHAIQRFMQRHFFAASDMATAKAALLAVLAEAAPLKTRSLRGQAVWQGEYAGALVHVVVKPDEGALVAVTVLPRDAVGLPHGSLTDEDMEAEMIAAYQRIQVASPPTATPSQRRRMVDEIDAYLTQRLRAWRTELAELRSLRGQINTDINEAALAVRTTGVRVRLTIADDGRVGAATPPKARSLTPAAAATPASKRLARQIAHSARMTADRDALASVMRLLLRACMHHRDDVCVEHALTAIAGSESLRGMLKPDFWEAADVGVTVACIIQTYQPEGVPETCAVCPDYDDGGCWAPDGPTLTDNGSPPDTCPRRRDAEIIALEDPDDSHRARRA